MRCYLIPFDNYQLPVFSVIAFSSKSFILPEKIELLERNVIQGNSKKTHN